MEHTSKGFRAGAEDPSLRGEALPEELFTTGHESWGRYPRATHRVIEPVWPHEVRIPEEGRPVLAYGQGRSYGDCCLNDGGTLIGTRWLNRMLAFDPASGVLRCEAGATFEQILRLVVPSGWFLPVTPGTQYVSVGGAIANDVHGKNHHRAGTFGCHVRSLELLRSNGERIVCSPKHEYDLFCATIGGLGLTGIILSVEFQLKRITGPLIDVESIKFENLDEFFELTVDSDRGFEYTVAWLDCVSGGGSFGRGIFLRGNHTNSADGAGVPHRDPLLAVPFDFPSWTLNRFAIRAFNTVYYNRQISKLKRFRSRYEPFFYPLDSVKHWNKIYGRRGFFQFQCVVPKTGNNKAIRELLRVIVESGRASFLAVLKEFGDIQSPGMLSFPRPGVTLCLDFPNQGEATFKLLQRLEELTCSFGGAIYPAKDAVMSPLSFRRFFPTIRKFEEFKDPALSSSLWRRLKGE